MGQVVTTVLRHMKDLPLTTPDGTKRLASHVDAFQKLRLGLADTFEKLKPARRKLLFRVKQKALVPEITEDRLKASSKRQERNDKKKTNSNAPSQARESAHSGEASSSTQLCS